MDRGLRDILFVAIVLLVGTVVGLRYFHLEQRIFGWSFTDWAWNTMYNGVMSIDRMLDSMLRTVGATRK